MSLRIRFRFDGKCNLHPRYDPARDGRPQHSNCDGCKSLYVIYLYIRIAKRRAETCNSIVARPVGRGEQQRTSDESSPPSESETNSF